MTRLERLRRELVALAESLGASGECPSCSGLGVVEVGKCAPCDGTGGKAPHPLAPPLRGIAWSLLPREERYREPEHGGGPMTAGMVDVEAAARDLGMLATQPGNVDPKLRKELLQLGSAILASVVQARPGETLDDVLRREGLSLSEPCEHCDGVGVEDNHEMCCQCAGSGEVPIEQTCGACVGVGGFEDVDGWRQCSECRNGRVVAEDAIEVRCAGQVRYARRREA